MMMSGSGHSAGDGHIRLSFMSSPSSQHQSRGFAVAFQFITSSYKHVPAKPFLFWSFISFVGELRSSFSSFVFNSVLTITTK